MATKTYIPRLKTKYQKEMIPALKEQFKFRSVMQVPKLEKICINEFNFPIALKY